MPAMRVGASVIPQYNAVLDESSEQRMQAQSCACLPAIA